MKMIYRSLECEVKVRSGLKVEIGELCADAVNYAVCRLFVRSSGLCREYVRESYCMRIANGKGKKSRRHRSVLPAFLAEMEGELLQIDFTVDSTGVTVQGILPVKCSTD